jgi:hypothetical protein
LILCITAPDVVNKGALVLAHSLRDAGTTKKLVALVTLDSVSAEAITELKVNSSWLWANKQLDGALTQLASLSMIM